MKKLLPVILCACLLPSTQGAEPAAPPVPERRAWRPVAEVDTGVLREASGLVASRRYPGVFWAHGDSGTDPKIVAFDLTGKILADVTVAGAPNTDWEDICADNDGHIYIGDIGNNTGMFPSRYVYKIAEPDPYHPPAEPITVIQRWRFKYPENKRVDCESLFRHGGSLYVIAQAGTRDSTVYRLDEDGPDDATMTPVMTLGVFHPTGADVSPDGTRLVVGSASMVWVFPLATGDALVDSKNRKQVTFPNIGGVEGCCFSGADVYLMAESGLLYRLSQDDIDVQRRFVQP